MPDNLFGAAQKNLANEDRTIGTFNQRMRYNKTPAQSPTAPAVNGAASTPPASSFSLNLTGDLSDQFSLGNNVPSYNDTSGSGRPSGWRFNGTQSNLPTPQSSPSDGSWRLAGFQNELAKPAVSALSGGATPTSPAAYNQTLAVHTPEAIKNFQSQYGWASGTNQEEN